MVANRRHEIVARGLTFIAMGMRELLYEGECNREIPGLVVSNMLAIERLECMMDGMMKCQKTDGDL